MAARGLAYVQFVLVVKAFSEEQIGIYAICLTSILLAELFANLGLDKIVIREVAAKGPTTSRPLFQSALLLKAITSMAVYPLCLVAIRLFYPDIFATYGYALLAFMAYIPASAMARSLESHFTAIEKMAIPAVAQFLERAVMLAAASAAYFSWFDFNLFLASFLVAGTVRAGFSAILHFMSRASGPLTTSPRNAFALVSEASWMFGAEVLAVIYFRVDIFMLSKMTDLYATGLYLAAYKVFEFFITMFSGYITAVFPAMSRNTTNLNPKLLGLGAAVIFVLFTIPAIVFRHDILRLFKVEYVQASDVLVALMLTLPILYCNSMLSIYAVADNQIRRLFLLALPILVLNIALNLVLIPSYGILGAGMATLVGELVLFATLVVAMKPFDGRTASLSILERAP